MKVEKFLNKLSISIFLAFVAGLMMGYFYPHKDESLKNIDSFANFDSKTDAEKKKILEKIGVLQFKRLEYRMAEEEFLESKIFSANTDINDIRLVESLTTNYILRLPAICDSDRKNYVGYVPDKQLHTQEVCEYLRYKNTTGRFFFSIYSDPVYVDYLLRNSLLLELNAGVIKKFVNFKPLNPASALTQAAIALSDRLEGQNISKVETEKIKKFTPQTISGENTINFIESKIDDVAFENRLLNLSWREATGYTARPFNVLKTVKIENCGQRISYEKLLDIGEYLNDDAMSSSRKILQGDVEIHLTATPLQDYDGYRYAVDSIKLCK